MDIQSFDARDWAKEFMRIYSNKKLAPQNHPDANWIDEELMIGWFANAIMAGYDKAKKEIEKLREEILKLTNPPLDEVDGSVVVAGDELCPNCKISFKNHNLACPTKDSNEKEYKPSVKVPSVAEMTKLRKG